MTSDQYKNPPIDEAVCEFTFNTSPDADFFTLPGKLHTLLQKDYSGKPREQPHHTVVANQAVPQPNISLQTELFRIQLPTADEKKLVSIGRKTLAVSILRPYTGWDEDFRGRVEVALRAYTKSPCLWLLPALACATSIASLSRTLQPAPRSTSPTPTLRTEESRRLHLVPNHGRARHSVGSNRRPPLHPGRLQSCGTLTGHHVLPASRFSSDINRLWCV